MKLKTIANEVESLIALDLDEGFIIEEAYIYNGLSVIMVANDNQEIYIGTIVRLSTKTLEYDLKFKLSNVFEKCYSVYLNLISNISKQLADELESPF